MDRLGNYCLCFTFPINKETTYLYSKDPDKMACAIQHAMETIMLFISSHGYISMEMVMKLLEFRPTRHCPGVIFTAIEDYKIEYDEINQTDLLIAWMSNDIKLRPVIRRQMMGEAVNELFDDSSESKSGYGYSVEHKNEKEEAECQTGPKETSESEENEKT